MEFDSTKPEFPVRVFFVATDGEESVSDEHGTIATDMDEVEHIAREVALAVMATRHDVTNWAEWEVNALTEERDGVYLDLGWFAFPKPDQRQDQCTAVRPCAPRSAMAHFSAALDRRVAAA